MAEASPLNRQRQLVGGGAEIERRLLHARRGELGPRVVVVASIPLTEAGGRIRPKRDLGRRLQLIEQTRAEQPDRHAQACRLAQDEPCFRGKELRHGRAGRRVDDKVKIGGGTGGFAAGEMVGGVVVAEKLPLPGRVGRAR